MKRIILTIILMTGCATTSARTGLERIQDMAAENAAITAGIIGEEERE